MIDALVTIVRKEMQVMLASPMGRRMLIMPVLLQLALFPFAATLEVKNSTLAILNEDGGAESVELIERLAAARAFPREILVHSEEELRQVVDRQQVLLAVRIPPDFSRRLQRGESAGLQAIVDGRRSNSAQIAYGYAAQVVGAYASERLGRPPPAQLVVRNLYNPNLEYKWFVLPSLVAIITTIGALMVTALSLSREKEQGTYDQLMVSPLTPAFIMAGKSATGILVSFVQGGIIILASAFVYRVPFTGSLATLLLAMLFYGLSLSGIGLFISSLCGSQQQAFLGAFSFMVPAVVLSGYMAPVENMPWLLRMLSAIDPISHFILVVKGVFLKGYGLADAWPHMWPLLAIGAVNMSIAYAIFRRGSRS